MVLFCVLLILSFSELVNRTFYSYSFQKVFSSLKATDNRLDEKKVTTSQKTSFQLNSRSHGTFPEFSSSGLVIKCLCYWHVFVCGGVCLWIWGVWTTVYMCGSKKLKLGCLPHLLFHLSLWDRISVSVGHADLAGLTDWPLSSGCPPPSLSQCVCPRLLHGDSASHTGIANISAISQAPFHAFNTS